VQVRFSSAATIVESSPPLHENNIRSVRQPVFTANENLAVMFDVFFLAFVMKQILISSCATGAP